MDKYDTSHLTEFPRFEPETPQSGVSSFFNKLWKIPLFSATEISGNSTSVSDNLSQEVPAHSRPNTSQMDNDGDSLVDPAFPVVPEARSLPNVLKRISSLVALGSREGMRYEDTEHARYWMPDDISKECYECAIRFRALIRRHHCRVCGQIFCNRCCSQRVPGQIFGCAGGLRVCTYCSNVVLSYLREHELSGDMSPDLKSLQENLQVKFPENKSNETPRKDFMFAGEPEERPDTRSGNKDTLPDVFRQLSFSLPTHQHRYRLIRYSDVWRGCDVLQWIMENTINKTRAQANLICQGLLNEGYIEIVTDVTKFVDYGLYKPITMPPIRSQDDSPEENPRIVESVSSYCLDLNLGDSSARLIKATKTENKSPSSEEESPLMQQSETVPEQKKICKAIAECGEDHLKLLLRQCLARLGLPATWLTVIYPLCHRAAQIITPDLNSNIIDIRKYVQIKKIPSGLIKDSMVVSGVVLTKHVTHRAMPQDLKNPSVLLLDCSIAYQRVEGKLTSLEPLLLQEQEYLVRCAARIAALQPNVVLVKGTAARTVQDALRKDGVALATGVGERALRRLSRCIDADVVTSVDSRVVLPKLGTCQRFYLNHYSGKTLMFLEGCAKPNLGCSILLRGAPLQELVRVKKVVKFMLLACYNWRLEHSFLNDIEAVLPEPGMTFDDDMNDIEIDRNDVNNDVKEDRTEMNDPLINKFVRKTDSDKTISCGVPIRDFSDPLRASQMSVDDEVFLPKEETKMKTDTSSVRWSADDAVLSMSPNIIIAPPYLTTEAGRKCHLRQYFNDPLFPEHRPQTLMTPKTLRRKISKQCDSLDCAVKEMHPFIHNAITKNADDVGLRTSLAHFRAVGSVYTNTHLPNCPKFKTSILKKVPPKDLETDQSDKPAAILDPLSPENHQRLSLLLYSYSEKSNNVPDFCVNPWIVTMEMYGQHDISLGAFLEKYCFNIDYKCPSVNCQIPMNQHVRKFIHEDGCITITCNTVNHSSGDKYAHGHKSQITVWTRCGLCGVSNRSARLSASSLRLSLAAYLQLRCRAPHYRPAACRHYYPAHYFHAAATCARVRYHKISTWDIELPPHVITTKYDTKHMRDSLISEINELMLKGHEVFNALSEVDCEKEHAGFKQQIEQIHLALTSETILQQTTAHGVVRWLWSIGDKIIMAEKLLRDIVEKLTPNCKTKTLLENIVEEKPDTEECMVADPNVNEATDVSKVDSDHQGEDDEEKGDKKTVRQILSQLLTNNQPSNQSGVIISGGVIPVIVYAGEIGSVIAATLASVQYQRQLHVMLHSHTSQPDQEESEHASNNKDKTDGDKTKATKNTEHIEVLLKDGLLCRVYYAAQFQKLRTMLLCPLDRNPHIVDEFAGNTQEDAKHDDGNTDGRYRVEEGFIRSLSRCEFWAARGGKSGSTFCKTKDDRYVLKEMSKPEWQQFLEFAPKYFTFVINCHQNKMPTLLARIVGVFSVASTGVLVMENLLYERPALSRRFDLKGAARHRLTADTHDAVLMDENMLNMRWESPLFLSSPAARVLWSAVERDTGFLTAHDVMDYSLLLGVGDGKLVLGIIDYIRTFTWDKKLEHYVKKNLGSGQPTVVSPEQYKQRFCAAMRKYFLHCPTQWEHLDTGLRHKV